MAKIDEENPALGWRAIRIGLDRPGLLRLPTARHAQGQRRARSARHVPMIANVAEFDLAKAITCGKWS